MLFNKPLILARIVAPDVYQLSAAVVGEFLAGLHAPGLTMPTGAGRL